MIFVGGVHVQDISGAVLVFFNLEAPFLKPVLALGVLQPMEIAQDTKPVAQAEEI